MIQNIMTQQGPVSRDSDLNIALRNIESVVWRASGIINVAQKDKHRPDLQRLARDTGAIVCAVLHRHTAAVNALVSAPNNLYGLQKLLEILSSIERFTEKRVSEHVFIRMVKRISDLPKVRRYEDDLEQILDCFELTSGDLVPQSLEHIASQLQQALRELAFQKGRQDEASTRRKPQAQGYLAQFPSQSQHTHTAITRTTVSGNQTTIHAALHVESINSGNSTTTITTNSNNVSESTSQYY